MPGSSRAPLGPSTDPGENWDPRVWISPWDELEHLQALDMQRIASVDVLQWQMTSVAPARLPAPAAGRDLLLGAAGPGDLTPEDAGLEKSPEPQCFSQA